MVLQKEISVGPFARGFHLITSEVSHALIKFNLKENGLAHIFTKHTSASITINENADFTVREDFESHFNHLVPENLPYIKHDYEGSDDMPAHLKASILGNSVTIPITNGSLNMGTWQGIYFCEHRNHASKRKLVITIMT